MAVRSALDRGWKEVFQPTTWLRRVHSSERLSAPGLCPPPQRTPRHSAIRTPERYCDQAQPSAPATAPPWNGSAPAMIATIHFPVRTRPPAALSLPKPAQNHPKTIQNLPRLSTPNTRSPAKHWRSVSQTPAGEIPTIHPSVRPAIHARPAHRAERNRTGSNNTERSEHPIPPKLLEVHVSPGSEENHPHHPDVGGRSVGCAHRGVNRHWRIPGLRRPRISGTCWRTSNGPDRCSTPPDARSPAPDLGT